MTLTVDTAPPDDPAEVVGDAPGGASAPARRRPPRAVWLATALFGLVLALWSVAVPAYRAPDEPAHLDLVLYLAEGNGYPAYDGRYFGEALRFETERHLVNSGRRWPVFDADDAPPRSDRPDVADLGGTTPDADAQQFDAGRPDYPYVYNQMPQHPPLYYMAMAQVLRLERWALPGDGVPSLDRELGLLRLVNVLLVTPLPLLAWAAVTRLGGSSRAGTVAALLPLGLPQLTHIGSSLNNDNLFLLLGGGLSVLLAGVARGRRGRGTDVAVGALLGLALLTKAFAVMFVPWVAAAYLIGAWTTKRRRPAASGLASAGALAALASGWFWIGNWVRYGEPAPTTETLTRTGDTRPPGFEADPWQFTWDFASRLVTRTWAWIGYRTPKFELPSSVVVLASVLALAAVVVAVARAGRGSATAGGLRRVDVAAAWLPSLLVTAFVMRRAWGLFQTTGLLSFIQGRYLFSALVGPMAVVGIGTALALRRWAVGATLALVATLQAWELSDVLRGSWSGPGPFGAVRGALAWSPWPPVLVLGAAAIAAALAVVLALQARRT